MPSPRAKLPNSRQLIDLYMRQDMTLREIAARYNCSYATVGKRLREACLEQGLTWPLKSNSKARSGRTKSVTTKMLRAEIVHCVRTYRVTQKQLAEAAGLAPNQLHQITSGHKERVLLSTARKIQDGIEKVERGHVASPTHIAPMLPKHARTHCAEGHPYGDRRNEKGHRYCNICLAAKHHRADQKRQAARRAAREAAA